MGIVCTLSSGLDLEAGKPLGHFWQNIPEPDEYFPFGQVRQLSAPLGLEKPAGQSVHFK